MGSNTGQACSGCSAEAGKCEWEVWAGCQDLNQSSPDARKEIHTHLGQEQGQPVLGQASSSSSGSAISGFLPIFSPHE